MNQNTLTDIDGSQQFFSQHAQYTRQRNPTISVIGSLITAIFGGLSVGYRLIFRRRIGILTLTPFSIIMAFFWIYLLFDVGTAAEYIKDYPKELLGYNESSFFYKPLSFFWFTLTLPYHAFGEPNEHWKSLAELNEARTTMLKFYAIGMVFSFFVLIRGFVILWIIAPRLIKKTPQYNPLSLGIPWGDSREDGVVYFPFKMSRRFNYRIITPLVVFSIGIFCLFIGLNEPKETVANKEVTIVWLSIFTRTGLYLTLGSFAMILNGIKYNKDVMSAKVMQLANKALAKERAEKYAEKKTKSLRRQPVSYGGRY